MNTFQHEEDSVALKNWNGSINKFNNEFLDRLRSRQNKAINDL